MSEEGTSDWQDVAVDAAAGGEWYVAVGDNQIGPVGLADVQRHIDAGEVDAASMAWKTGMADWLPVSDIPELATLLPQKSDGAADIAIAPAQVQAPPSAGVPNLGNFGPVTFHGDSGGNSGGAAVDWKPSAASALSALVQEEIVHQKEDTAAKSAAAAAPAGMPALAPGLGGVDLFSANASLGTPSLATPQAAGWSVPSGPPRKQGTPVWVWALIGVVAFLGISAAVVVVVVLPRLQPGVPANAVAQAQAPGVAAPAPAGANGAAPAAQPGAPAGTAAAPAAANEDESERGKKGGKADRGSKTSPTTKGGKAEGGKADGKKGSGGGLEDLFDEGGGGKKGGAAKGPDVPKLEKTHIVAGVKSNAGALMPCLQKARQKGEVAPGTYTIPLEWTINPNGSVSGGRMTGPANLMGTSLPGCVASAMRGWKFPSSNAGAPIKGFPFGPFSVK